MNPKNKTNVKPPPTEKLSTYRESTPLHNEIQLALDTFLVENRILTLWQGKNIQTAKVISIDEMSDTFTLTGEQESSLQFTNTTSLYFFSEEDNIFGKSDIICDNHDQNTVTIKFPSLDAIKFPEGRSASRVGTLAFYVAIDLQKNNFPGPVSGLYMVNISPKGMAVRVADESNNLFSQGECVEWCSLRGTALKKKIPVTISHITEFVPLPKLGDNNTIIGINFDQPFEKKEYVKLLEKLFKDSKSVKK